MSAFTSTSRLLLKGAPTALTLLVLAGVGYVGHRTGWKLSKAAEMFGREADAAEEWCDEHGVPEATCVICRGLTGGAAMAPGAAKPKLVQIASAEAARQAGVEVAPAERRSIADVIETYAEVSYDRSRYAQVSARLPGMAALVRAEVGQRVRAGDILALIDSAEVGKAKAELLQAAATLASKQAILQRTEESMQAGLRIQTDLLAAQADVNDASIRLFNARQALINLGLPVPAIKPGEAPSEHDIQFLGLPPDVASAFDATQATANLLPVVAPLDGVVVDRNVLRGELVDPSRPLFVVADTSHMWIHADLPLSQAGRVHVGQALSFVADIPDAQPIVGSVIWISPQIDDRTRTVRVRAEVRNEGGQLFAQTFGRARITVRPAQSAVVVPLSAIQRDHQAALVFLRKSDELFEARDVRLGIQAGEDVEIVDGITAGDVIAVRGSYVLFAQLNRTKLGAGCAD